MSIGEPTYPTAVGPKIYPTILPWEPGKILATIPAAIVRGESAIHRPMRGQVFPIFRSRAPYLEWVKNFIRSRPRLI